MKIDLIVKDAVIFSWISDTWFCPETKSLTLLIRIAALYSEVISYRELLVVIFDPFFLLSGKMTGPNNWTTLVRCETFRLVGAVRLLHQQQESYFSMPSVTFRISFNIDWRFLSRTDLANLSRCPLWPRHTTTLIRDVACGMFRHSSTGRCCLVWVNENIYCGAW